MANGNSGNGSTPVKAIRCAIYTRKSTDEGLNQDFNSLDAQREAGEAYIRSQAGEGWTLVPDQYDDGGYTGANMERPGLRRLLADAQTRKVDCVVAGQLHQVLLNLVVNARDAMPHGGTLTISTSNEDISAPDAHVSGIAPGKYVQLAIADTGTGITEEVRSHMFEPFYTTKEAGKGTGLGLSTVYGIVQQNGGHVGVETELGKGTVFRIRLPAVAPESAPAKEPGAGEAMPRGTETILLVEDQEEVRDVYATILRGLVTCPPKTLPAIIEDSPE